MIKQISLSFLAGLFVTALLMVAPNAKAACQGYCADRIISPGCGELSFSGCSIHYDQNGTPYDVDCFYSGACGPAPEQPGQW